MIGGGQICGDHGGRLRWRGGGWPEHIWLPFHFPFCFLSLGWGGGHGRSTSADGEATPLDQVWLAPPFSIFFFSSFFSPSPSPFSATATKWSTTTGQRGSAHGGWWWEHQHCREPLRQRVRSPVDERTAVKRVCGGAPVGARQCDNEYQSNSFLCHGSYDGGMEPGRSLLIPFSLSFRVRVWFLSISNRPSLDRSTLDLVISFLFCSIPSRSTH